jgi:hypothetical protein
VLPNRKRVEFVRCPVCGTEFRRFLDQRWCSRERAGAARRRAKREAKRAAAPALTPEAIQRQVGTAAGMMWRELVRRPARKDRP